MGGIWGVELCDKGRTNDGQLWGVGGGEGVDSQKVRENSHFF